MNDATAERLKRVIETQHHPTAVFARSVRVLRAHSNANMWDGVVHIFNLQDHPKAKKAYAWSVPVDGRSQPRYFAVLHSAQVTCPADAVRAAVWAVNKYGKAPAGKK
ncbi:MAG TPA: hypothetical protein VEH07_02300 [Alphaproteobacteria bacterium]|nr:hypothetical protein [Alphaproteobacteria bacterium]